MNETRAADLPIGSVVASPTLAWIKSHPDAWYDTTDWDNPASDSDISDKLRLGEVNVLRVGDGAS